MDHTERMSRLRTRMGTAGIDAFFVTNLVNIRYLCGFTGSNALLLVGHDGAWFFSDGRYKLQAAREVAGADVEILESHDGVLSALRERRAASNLARIGFEGGDVTVASRRPGWELPPGMDKLRSYFEGADLVATSRWVEELRRVKEAAEIEMMRRAAELADETLSFVLSKARPGVTERELALQLEFHARRAGADDVSFDPIVAAAEGSAFVHGRPSERQIQEGRFLLLDLGCKYEGYCSDLTRTVVVGRADSRHKEMYEAVRAAQEAALIRVAAGVPASHVDGAARSVLTASGLGDAFPHGLGHGVGLQIHEEPSLKKETGDPLEVGNVITVEPGAYLEGWGGVRIEDLVVVREGSPEILSTAPRQLIEV